MNDEQFTQEQAQRMFDMIQEVYTYLETMEGKPDGKPLNLYQISWKKGIESFYNEHGFEPKLDPVYKDLIITKTE